MHTWIEPGQPFSDLRRAPARLVLLQAHDPRLDLKWQLIGVAVESARAVGQPFQAAIVVARKDLVAGLARDAELAAQHCHLLSVQQLGDELQPFIHRVTLPPGHFCSPRKRPNV
jgi:hypothetical protein